MTVAVVAVSNPADWALDVPGVEVVLARDYLSDPRWSQAKGLRVYNLCRRYRYQSEGYYVSLLATARGQVPIPSLTTLLEMRSRTMVRAVDEDLEDLIQRDLSSIKSDEFVLSIYFGRNVAKRYRRLAGKLFNLFPAPLLRAHFARIKERWRLQRIGPIPAREIPDHHLLFVLETAREYFHKPRFQVHRRREPRYHLAILVDPEEVLPPSNAPAIRRFERAAAKVGFGVEIIGRDDFSRLAEFDALFIRVTTRVDHYTFRFAQRAQNEGLVVIDDVQSIIRCSNKVYLAEALEFAGIPVPRTVVGNRQNLDEIGPAVGFPCVLKYPDSSFSQGVSRCQDPEELMHKASGILATSDLFVAQEWVPTPFDWRVGVFGGKALYACRYHMAEGHWQIVHTLGAGKYRHGRVEPVPLSAAPPGVVRTAERAAGLIGQGFYGVDLKRLGRRNLVMEVNDNPNVDEGCEDAILKNALYETIMRGMLERVERRKNRR
jgi:glutathione synthase/RimK-type ligase-like ATP-grasp enzyme